MCETQVDPIDLTALAERDPCTNAALQLGGKDTSATAGAGRSSHSSTIKGSGNGDANADADEGHDIILQAAEGRRFRFSLEILAKYSLFAESMLGLPSGRTAGASHSAVDSDTPPTVEVPVRAGALSFALESIMDLCHAKELPRVPSMYILDVFTFCDMLDCPRLLTSMLQTMPEPPAQFTLAILAGDDARVYDLSPPLLAYSAEYYTGAWWTEVLAERAPHVLRQLATLFDNWNSSYLYFQAKMSPELPRTVFSHTQYWLPSGVALQCDQRRKHRGSFAAFHAAAIRPLWDTFATHPLVHPLTRSLSGCGEMLRQLRPSFAGLADNIAMLGIECSICRTLLLDDVRGVLESWPAVDWCGKRALGLAVPPSPADMEAWRVYLKPQPPLQPSASLPKGWETPTVADPWTLPPSPTMAPFYHLPGLHM